MCPFCSSERFELFFRDALHLKRDYLLCADCGLVFVPAKQHLSIENEKIRYDFHRNDIADAGYRGYLNRLAGPMIKRLSPGSEGLDFGSGPGRVPVLAGIFAEAGHAMDTYDPIYAPDTGALSRRYDFVAATEVVEHLRMPAKTLGVMWDLVKPGGWLGILTQFLPEKTRFGGWRYKDDPTHICFFSAPIFERLAASWNAALNIVEPGVILLQKSSLSPSGSGPVPRSL